MTGLLLAGVLLAAADTSGSRLVDGFERLDAWTPHPADGVELAIRGDRGRTGRAMRLDFSFVSGGGYAIAHRATDLDLPSNYAFSFWIRGEARPNTLEFKLIDRSGENVWWYTERDRVFDGAWHRITIRRRQIAFAWGPQGGGTLEHVAALELVITAGRGGGAGRVWFDDLTLTALPDLGPYDQVPRVSATSAAAGHAPAALLDGDSTTSWRSTGTKASVTIDFGRPREYGGITLSWETARAARQYAVLLSDDGRRWRILRRHSGGARVREYLYLPDTESRFLRLDLATSSSHGIGLREVRIEPLEWAASRNAFFTAISRDAPRGSFPRYFSGERANWTVVGVHGAREEALLNEDGAVESGSGGFSVEPFVTVNGRLISWADVSSTPSLASGRLPIPSVDWRGPGMSLTVTALAIGADSASSVVARYRLRNSGVTPLRGTFYAAIRPFQVNPPWQFLGTPGGVSRIDSLRWNGREVVVNGDRAVVPLTRPSAAGAAAFEAGDVVEYLSRGALPPRAAARDSFGAASGVLAWPVALAPGDSTSIALEIPLVARHRALLAGHGMAGVDSALAAEAAGWGRAVDRATIELPPVGDHLSRTIASTLGYILINRDGPAIQPGSRSYERSWIRDGALTSAALLRFGHADLVREFLLWYATYQYANGKIPCCVDRRGADPVPEHDSNGEFIYLVMEYFRDTGDRPMLDLLWPRVSKAVAYLDSLRRTERAGDALFAGLLPPSISHEGYSAKPMHSYWDDFFALRGFKDAAAMAAILGKTDDATRLDAIRDEFARDLYASIGLAMARHHIDFIPGSADLGDFDATSTTIAVAPGGELTRLPHDALERTFERYWAGAIARRDSTTKWDAYTPYELRTVGTMLRMGWKDRALDLLDGFLRDQEPIAWNQWPEVVWHDPRAPKFIGDMPHTWVGSDFLRSAADLFAYEREADSALVVGAGISDSWLAEPGVRVTGLHTWWGPLSYTVRRAGAATTFTIEGGLRIPPGGVVVNVPGAIAGTRVVVNGEAMIAGPNGTVAVRSLPARIVLAP